MGKPVRDDAIAAHGPATASGGHDAVKKNERIVEIAIPRSSF